MRDCQPGASGAANESTWAGRGKDVTGGGGGIVTASVVVVDLSTMQMLSDQTTCRVLNINQRARVETLTDTEVTSAQSNLT